MGQSGFAFFCPSPECLEDLIRPHFPEQERRFSVAAEIRLGKTEYENFITDMLADRQFIEDHAAECERGEIWRCILVRQRGRRDGVLVMPGKTRGMNWLGSRTASENCTEETPRHVGWAAYLHEQA